MTLKQLEAFLAAAHCASFAVAAERLHLSISSLSKRIAELEQALGERLFDRSGHRATLTPAGSRLLPRAMEVLQSADRLLQAVGKEGGPSGHCRFGVGELAALTWLPRLLKRAAQAFPQLLLEPYVDMGASLEQGVLDGRLDFAVIAGRSSNRALLCQPVAQAHFVWVAAPRLLAEPESFTAQQLRRHTLVTLHVGAGTTRILDDWLGEQRVEVERRISCNGWGAVAGLLVDGVGVGFLPEGWAHALAQRGQLQLLSALPGLAPLHYTLQARRDNARLLEGPLRELVAECLDFSASSGLF